MCIRDSPSLADDMRKEAAVRIDQGFDKLEAKPQETQTAKKTMNIFYARTQWNQKAN